MAQKLFLLSSQQLQRLKQQPTEPSMRQTAEHELDVKMRAILNDSGLNAYEKVKKYNALLQRYLSLSKQGEREGVTFTLQEAPQPGQVAGPEHAVPGAGQQQQQQQLQQPGPQEDAVLGPESMIEEVLKNLPQRERKNADYVLRKLPQAQGGWTSKGEFIYRGEIMRGSHMIDLFKNLIYGRKKPAAAPKGWISFLNALKKVNIPLSSVKNPQARQQYQRLQSDEELDEIHTHSDSEEMLKKLDAEENRKGGRQFGFTPEETPRRSGSSRKLAPRWLHSDPEEMLKTPGVEEKRKGRRRFGFTPEETPRRSRSTRKLAPRWLSM